jgi:hypothetical protein
MQWTLALATVMLLAARAGADARLDQLVKGYEREQTSCRVHEGGVSKMLDGATMLLEQGHEDGLAEDVKSLHAAHEVVASYCAALAAAIEFLRADPSASYRSLEKALGERDNHIRTLRASSKKVLEDTEPLIQRWIPKINAARIENDKFAIPKPTPRSASSDAPPRKSEQRSDARSDANSKPDVSPTQGEPMRAPSPSVAKFPSGRTAKLPQRGGTWDVRGDATTDIAEYVDRGNHTSVVAEVFIHVSCAAQLARLQAKAYGRQAAKDQAGAGQVWRVRLPGDSPSLVACAVTRTGSAMVTVDAPDASHPDLSELAWSMLGSLTK